MAYDGISYKGMSDGMKRCHAGINKNTRILESDPNNEEARIMLREYKELFQHLKETHSVDGVYQTGRYNYNYKRKKCKEISVEEINKALSNLPGKGQPNEAK